MFFPILITKDQPLNTKKMTLLDLFFALFLGVFIYIGWKRGAVREAAALAGVLIGIWAAVHFSRLIALMLGLRGESAILIAFFIVFVGTLVLASLLGRTADRVVKAVKMNLPNKIAGAALGMIKAICICSVILNGIILIDNEEKLISKDTREKSLLYSPIYSTGNELLSSLKDYIDEHPELKEKIVETSDNVTEKAKDKEKEAVSKQVGKKIDKKSEKKGGRK